MAFLHRNGWIFWPDYANRDVNLEEPVLGEGLAGEEFVAQFEHWRLIELGQPRLADKVEHVAKTKGDGLGYDVRSYDSDGKELLIEVKTTTFGRDTPFFVSRGELALSHGAQDQFHLYRMFEFRSAPRFMRQNQPLDHAEPA